MCNRCGSRSPAGATTCQRCGALLPGTNEQGFSPRRGAQEQAELPAWLESLRTSDRPSARSSSGFDPIQGVDEGTLPDWMRAVGGEAKETPLPQSTLRPSSFSAPNTDERSGSRPSINANSLIDEQSLPAWMRQDGPPPAAQKNIPASSLVQSDSVPEWMRTLQQQPPASMSAQAAQSPIPMSPLPPDFSAGDLIDPQSLPSWMAQQGESTAAPVPSKGQKFSASSLLDMNALPAWMRESDTERGTTPGTAYGNAPEQTQRDNSAPRAQQSQQQAFFQPPQSPLSMQSPTSSPVNQIAESSGPQNNLSAASFIERNALPEWLRAEAEQHPASPTSPVSPPPGSSGNMPPSAPRPGPYVNPPRGAESVRVPTRPRGEMGLPESSEVAANVFASMLGVASHAPQFPAQGQGMATGQRPPQQGMQPGMPPTQYGPQGQIPAAFPPGAPPQQMPQGYPSGAHNQSYPGNFQPNAQMGVPPTMMPPQGQPNSIGMSPMEPGMPGEQRGNPKPVKRNLFEAIRNWLFRS
ncbi:MAG TPA: hypothetical protein VFA10_22155 [Ktedonobacteraceae bacterium]|nr:hypothetical protein [Ktedonobacteraceae bacterium]